MIDSIILGCVQGITEFLPVSSTAHTALVEKFFLLKSLGKDFCVLLNLGTVLSIAVYYYKEAIEFVMGGWDVVRNKSSNHSKFFWLLVLSNIPTIVILGALDYMHIDISSMTLTAVNLIVFGVILYWCDQKPTTNKEFTLKDGLKIGIAQILSFLPGVSRLGICLSVCRFLEYDRRESFKFSMILSVVPVMGACSLTLLKVVMASSMPLLETMLGGVVAFLCGLVTLYVIDQFFKKYTLIVFVIYRIILGVTLVII